MIESANVDVTWNPAYSFKTIITNFRLHARFVTFHFPVISPLSSLYLSLFLSSVLFLLSFSFLLFLLFISHFGFTFILTLHLCLLDSATVPIKVTSEGTNWGSFCNYWDSFCTVSLALPFEAAALPKVAASVPIDATAVPMMRFLYLLRRLLYP